MFAIAIMHQIGMYSIYMQRFEQLDMNVPENHDHFKSLCETIYNLVFPHPHARLHDHNRPSTVHDFKNALIIAFTCAMSESDSTLESLLVNCILEIDAICSND